MPKGPRRRAERQHHVGLGDELHGRLRALVAERAAPQRMIGGEAVVVQVAVDDGAPAGTRPAPWPPRAARHDDAAAGDDHRELGLGQHVGRLVEALLGARTAGDAAAAVESAVDLAVEVVARDVELRRPALGHAPCVDSSAPCDLGMRADVFTWPWKPVILEKIGSWSVSAEAAEPHAHRA